MQRYSRHVGVIGEKGINKLQSSKVAVVGLGGLGGVVSELLVRYGVGSLFVCDGDKFEISNLNRQLLSNEKTIGSNKAKVALQRLTDININLKLEIMNKNFCFDDVKNDEANLLKTCDIVCDCLGDFESKIKLERLCIKIGKPVVHAAVEHDKFIVGTVECKKQSWEEMFGFEGVKIPESVDPSTVWVAASIEAKETVMYLLNSPNFLGKIYEGSLTNGKIRVF